LGFIDDLKFIRQLDSSGSFDSRWCRSGYSIRDYLVRPASSRTANPARSVIVAKVSTYLNFKGNTFEVFEFYKSVFGTEYSGPVTRMGDVNIEGMPPAGDDTKDLIMNIQLPILGGHLLMGTDTPGEWGDALIIGNNVSIMLHTDSREQADELFAACSCGGKVEMAMADQFWGDYYGSFDDKYGVSWMLVHSPAR